MEIKFSYHPGKKVLLLSDLGENHADTIHKRGKGLPFDEFIRGIITEKTVFLRSFYPWHDINERSADYINKQSFDLLFDNKKAVFQALKKAGVKFPRKVAYNTINADLRGFVVNI